ncbi:hypothetical protein STEG23_032257 [Scotinomys teguina]
MKTRCRSYRECNKCDDKKERSLLPALRVSIVLLPHRGLENVIAYVCDNIAFRGGASNGAAFQWNEFRNVKVINVPKAFLTVMQLHCAVLQVFK